MYLLDTNVLVYAVSGNSKFHSKAKKLRDKAHQGKIKACISVQILAEFYAVVTNPKLVSPPLKPIQAIEAVQQYQNSINIKKLEIKTTTLKILTHLLKKYEILKQDVFDCLIVATILDSKAKGIYTNNIGDFQIYKDEIEIINPFHSSQNPS